MGPFCMDAAYTVAKLIKRSRAHVGHIHTSPMPELLAAKVHNTSWGLHAPADNLANASWNSSSMPNGLKFLLFTNIHSRIWNTHSCSSRDSWKTGYVIIRTKAITEASAAIKILRFFTPLFCKMFLLKCTGFCLTTQYVFSSSCWMQN